ncbi:hypothetical protein ISCGN_031385 [Ixodes scapularis]
MSSLMPSPRVHQESVARLAKTTTARNEDPPPLKNPGHTHDVVPDAVAAGAPGVSSTLSENHDRAERRSAAIEKSRAHSRCRPKTTTSVVVFAKRATDSWCTRGDGIRDDTDVLLQIKEDILDRISCTTTRAVLALDIKGAFDNVSHTLVFENLASTGCGPRMYDYVRDFLSNWTATIGIESIRTSTIPIPSKGNRQGSVLSPTFGRQDFLEEVIETVQNYLEAGNLQRAPDKSQLLLLRAGKPIPEEEEGGHPPHRDGGAKYTVDRLVKTTTQVMRMVRRITSHRHGLEESDLIRLTQPLVVSHIACANPYLNLTCCREELINMHLASQWEHLALTLSGRHAPSSLGIPIPASQCEAIQLLLALWDKIQVAPIP